MPRRREIRKREVLPDPKYHDPLVAKFMNGIMRRGKKSVAESIFYGALNIIQERIQSDPMKTFKQAMDNVKPLIEVRPRRVGGATYQVPVEVRPERKMALAIR
jgi:small subunit ribosomal protein S7